uniref:Insulin-like peptide 4 n=1 Tax=Maruca vitrata TaxID=497515 RepID=A0A385KNT5_MARVT|nr:insulin-like peptide 4 [Maruca vitrata]
MKLQYALYIAILLCHQNVCILAEEGTRTYKITDKVSICSSFLALLINKFCDNVYKIEKRDTSLMIDKLTPRTLHKQRNKERVLTEARWRRVRRQIATECCDQACTVANIIKYCPDDAKLLKERPDIFN